MDIGERAAATFDCKWPTKRLNGSVPHACCMHAVKRLQRVTIGITDQTELDRLRFAGATALLRHLSAIGTGKQAKHPAVWHYLELADFEIRNRQRLERRKQGWNW